jgi:outer membrane immunogenic protein
LKKLLLGAIATVAIATIAFSATAFAADLSAPTHTYAPASAPMIAAPIYDWSGFYIGINGGGGSSRKCWDLLTNVSLATIPATPEGCHNATGGIVGGQIGYRWQSAAWVFGLEAQGDWSNLSGSNISVFASSPSGPFPNLLANRSKIDAIGLLTGQVGYSWNTFLLYVKGGAAVTHDRYEGFTNVASAGIPAGTIFDRASETRWGGVVGLGGEYAFAGNWSVGLEYDHLFMGSRSNILSTGGGVAGEDRRDNIRQDVDMLTARINYRFGGPVVARY